MDEFVKKLGSMLVAKAKMTLSKYGFDHLDIIFSYRIDKDNSFTIKVMCEEYIYEVPRINALDFSSENIVNDIEDYAKSYGSFMAWDYLDNKNIKVDYKDVYKSCDDTWR